jgi:hypothetical protein
MKVEDTFLGTCKYDTGHDREGINFIDNYHLFSFVCNFSLLELVGGSRRECAK